MLPAIAELLATIALAVGTHGMSNPAVQRWLQIAASLVERGGVARAEIEALTSLIQQMVEEEREPTAAEWDDLIARSGVAHEVIQNWSPEP